VLDAFGKNEQVKKIFWILFITLVGLVPARIADPTVAPEGHRDAGRDPFF